jgi:hypothetical protein
MRQIVKDRPVEIAAKLLIIGHRRTKVEADSADMGLTHSLYSVFARTTCSGGVKIKCPATRVLPIGSNDDGARKRGHRLSRQGMGFLATAFADPIETNFDIVLHRLAQALAQRE